MSQFEGLTLEKVGKGNLEEQFQEALAEVAEAFGRAHDGIYKPNTDNELRCTITLSIELVHDVETLTTTAFGGLDKVKRPARVRKGTQVFLAGGAVAIEKSKQSDLFASDKGK